MYPTLLLGISGSIPTAVELVRSGKLGVAFGQSAAASQQEALWTKNLRCIGAPIDGLLTEYNVTVDATICKSGDVLVRFLGPHDTKAYKWVPVERFEPKSTAMTFLSQAVAQTPPKPGDGRAVETVVCQWAPAAGFVIRRVRDSRTNLCYNEHIRTATGEVVSRPKVDCNSQCASIADH